MEIFKIPFRAMASHCEVVIASNSKTEAQYLAQLAIDEVMRIEIKYSRYRPDSIISKINSHSSKKSILCDDETWSLLDYANALFQTSDGLFDITSGVLRRAWHFKEKRRPSDEDLAQLLPLIGWQQVEREDQKIFLPKSGMEIDFGGFGKEYAADRVASILSHKDVRSGYVNLGGDMRVLGPKSDGQAWMIGIQDPRQKNALIATIPVETGGLATSGDYERFFELDGQRYCHILNPKTGQPVSYWRSISVLSHFSVVAGNCTTIAMLKESEGRDYLESTGMRYLAVDQHGEIFVNQSS
jgi:thiamine biosynthesis lipoprotein